MTTTAAKPKTVLITGAAGNLGQAVAHALRAAGHRLVLLDRSLESLQKAFGPDGHTDSHTDCMTQMSLAVDLLARDAVAQAVATATARMGAPDALCHLAGSFDMGAPVHGTTDELLDHLLDLNLRSLLPISAAVVPGMLAAGAGSIVTVGAMGAIKGGAHMGAYAASKSALMRLTESMSAELKVQGIRVNCVLPSIIDTPPNRAAMPDADPAHWVAPAALADVIAFLISDQARAIHGSCLPVTGLS